MANETNQNYWQYCKTADNGQPCVGLDTDYAYGKPCGSKCIYHNSPEHCKKTQVIPKPSENLKFFNQ
jgi:hypothetical protein